MLVIHINTGHERTVDAFVKEMEASGYILAGRYKSVTMPSSTIKLHRPVEQPEGWRWVAAATVA